MLLTPLIFLRSAPTNTPVQPRNTYRKALFLERQQAMLRKNVGYNVSPEEWFSRYTSLGLEGTFLTDYRAVALVLGPIKGGHRFVVGILPGKGKVSMLTAWRLERALGLSRGSLWHGFRVSRIRSIRDIAPRSPLSGNKYFLGPGEGLPGGGPEMVVDPIPTSPWPYRG